MTGVSYPERGGTRRDRLPAGYSHLHVETVVGRDAEAFGAAADAVLTWRMHRGAGVIVDPSDAAVAEGARVRLRWGIGSVRVTAPCEIVYVIDEPGRKGFAYGTLPGHPEIGEERFAVEHRTDGSVVLVIRAFSRPGPWWARWAAPVTRSVQRRITAGYGRALALLVAVRTGG